MDVGWRSDSTTRRLTAAAVPKLAVKRTISQKCSQRQASKAKTAPQWLPRWCAFDNDIAICSLRCPPIIGGSFCDQPANENGEHWLKPNLGHGGFGEEFRGGGKENQLRRAISNNIFVLLTAHSTPCRVGRFEVSTFPSCPFGPSGLHRCQSPSSTLTWVLSPHLFRLLT